MDRIELTTVQLVEAAQRILELDAPWSPGQSRQLVHTAIRRLIARLVAAQEWPRRDEAPRARLKSQAGQSGSSLP
jgi:hypothetical protein